jgi:hypothetical protein
VSIPESAAADVAMTREQIEATLGEPSLRVTHFKSGRLVGTVSDDSGCYALVSDGISTLYEDAEDERRAMRATTRLACQYLLNEKAIF